MFLQHIKWVGKVEWHTDSQSVIGKWNNLQPNWEPDWHNQKAWRVDETVAGVAWLGGVVACGGAR